MIPVHAGRVTSRGGGIEQEADRENRADREYSKTFEQKGAKRTKA